MGAPKLTWPNLTKACVCVCVGRNGNSQPRFAALLLHTQLEFWGLDHRTAIRQRIAVAIFDSKTTILKHCRVQQVDSWLVTITGFGQPTSINYDQLSLFFKTILKQMFNRYLSTINQDKVTTIRHESIDGVTRSQGTCHGSTAGV